MRKAIFLPKEIKFEPLSVARTEIDFKSTIAYLEKAIYSALYGESMIKTEYEIRDMIKKIEEDYKENNMRKKEIFLDAPELSDFKRKKSGDAELYCYWCGKFIKPNTLHQHKIKSPIGKPVILDIG